MKIWKLTGAWSAVGSPRPSIGTFFLKVSDQLLSVPVMPLALSSMIRRVQVPLELIGPPMWPETSAWRNPPDCCGWNDAEERRTARQDRGRRVVVEDRVGEIRVRAGRADVLEQLDRRPVGRDQVGLEVGIVGVRDVELDAHPLDGEAVGDEDRRVEGLGDRARRGRGSSACLPSCAM